ncbi:MAG: transglutaminase-like domain-containing protein [Eubacteriales bacterium]|nr:transglutaminase-like domain-containing protein [Eubacteriales bacterium]
MQLIRENRPYEDYLQAKGPVNRDESRVSFVAEHLMGKAASFLESADPEFWTDPETVVVKLTYEYVRDKIKNSNPATSAKLTWKASEVLNEKEGTDFAKANLMAGLLRRNGIPTGFAYQYHKEGDQLVLHALNAVYLESLGGWLRLDASYSPEATEHSALDKNMADFASVDSEALVFAVDPARGEDNLPILYAEPDEQLEKRFAQSKSVAEFWSLRPARLASAEHDHRSEKTAGSARVYGGIDNGEHDDQLLDLLYGDPDDDEFGCSSGSCSGCSGGCH